MATKKAQVTSKIKNKDFDKNLFGLVTKEIAEALKELEVEGGPRCTLGDVEIQYEGTNIVLRGEDGLTTREQPRLTQVCETFVSESIDQATVRLEEIGGKLERIAVAIEFAVDELKDEKKAPDLKEEQ